MALAQDRSCARSQLRRKNSSRGDKAMYSRRAFLTGMFLFVPFMLAPTKFLNKIHSNLYSKRSKRLVKQGWVLRAGDV